MKSYPLARIVRDLVVYDPEPALLRHYAKFCKDQAVKTRARYAVREEQANAVIWRECAKHQDLWDKINEVKRRIRLRRKGTPLTETLDDPGEPMGCDLGPSKLSLMSDADQVIMKKAWRAVLSVLGHPDTNPDLDIALWNFLHRAYKDGDLGALQEFMISYEKTVMEQIYYWKSEAQKPEIKWQMLQGMDQFQVLKAVMRGDKETAARISREIVEAQLHTLEVEELMIDDEWIDFSERGGEP